MRDECSEMNLRLTGVSTPTPSDWDAVWQTSPQATYFQSRQWGEIWEGYSRGRIQATPLAFTFSDQSRLILPLYISKKYKGMGRKCVLSPAHSHGGWISKGRPNAAHGKRVWSHLIHHLGKRTLLEWRISPFIDFPPPATLAPAGRHTADVTHLLDLKDGFSALQTTWQAGKGAMARKIKKAEGAGVRIRRARTPQDWADYFEIYQQSLARWGKARSLGYGNELFELLRRRDPDHVALWLGEYENRRICGALCFSSPHHTVYWHGAALSEYFHLRPVNLLMARIIQDAAEKGCRWFDFNPSGGYDGVARFKESFKPIPHPVPVLTHRPLAMDCLERVSQLKHQIRSQAADLPRWNPQSLKRKISNTRQKNGPA